MLRYNKDFFIFEHKNEYSCNIQVHAMNIRKIKNKYYVFLLFIILFLLILYSPHQTSSRTDMATNVFDFGSLASDDHAFSAWLKEHQLIKSEVACPECCSIMKEVAGKRLWICSKRGQHPSGKVARESMLKGTIFQGARAYPDHIMKLCYCFSLKMTYSNFCVYAIIA